MLFSTNIICANGKRKHDNQLTKGLNGNHGTQQRKVKKKKKRVNDITA